MDITGKPDFFVSITDREGLTHINEKFDGIFHFAAMTSPPEFEIDPLGGFENNVSGTLNILELAKRCGANRVVLASSSAVYGNTHSVSVEDSTVDKFENLYPITKVINELLAKYYSLRNDLECISLRYFNTFGPGENTKGGYSSQISKFLNFAMNSEPIIVYGDGTQSRDFIYVKDNALASVLAFDKGRPGEAYNIGTGISTDFNSIAKLVKSITLSDSEIVHIPNPLKSYQMFTQTNISKARRDLKFQPHYDLKSAITEMYEIEKR